MSVPDLAAMSCKPCEGEAARLDEEEAARYLEQLPGWAADGPQAIAKAYTFRNYYHTMAFVNAVAWLAHRHNHHPDLEVGFNRVRVYYTTHAAGGLTENDFICAAKVDALFNL